jgi:glutaconate CoA-transferase subunit B
MNKLHYTLTELMVVAAARELPDNEAVLIGTGLPLAAGALAKKTHAPNLVLCFEAGGVGPEKLTRLPLTVGEGITAARPAEAASMAGIMSMAGRGFIRYGFLGGAQIDMYGNLNSTVIGSYAAPAMRFPGSGGANDIGSLCARTLIIMKHERRRFLAKIDFVTTPGYLSGPGAREKAGLPENSGPYRVISTLGVMAFDPASKRMVILKTYPGVTMGAIREETGFELPASPDASELEPPSAEELHVLRTAVDPQGALATKQ